MRKAGLNAVVIECEYETGSRGWRARRDRCVGLLRWAISAFESGHWRGMDWPSDCPRTVPPHLHWANSLVPYTGFSEAVSSSSELRWGGQLHCGPHEAYAENLVLDLRAAVPRPRSKPLDFAAFLSLKGINNA